MTARVSFLLKSRASLTCFPACFLPGRAKDLSAPRYVYVVMDLQENGFVFMLKLKCRHTQQQYDTVLGEPNR